MGSLGLQPVGRGGDIKCLKFSRIGRERWPGRRGGSRRWTEGAKTTLV